MCLVSGKKFMSPPDRQSEVSDEPQVSHTNREQTEPGCECKNEGQEYDWMRETSMDLERNAQSSLFVIPFRLKERIKGTQ